MKIKLASYTDYRLNLRVHNPKEVMLDPDTLEDYLPEVQKRWAC